MQKHVVSKDKTLRYYGEGIKAIKTTVLFKFRKSRDVFLAPATCLMMSSSKIPLYNEHSDIEKVRREWEGNGHWTIVRSRGKKLFANTSYPWQSEGNYSYHHIQYYQWAIAVI